MLTRKVSFLGWTCLFVSALALGGEAIPNWPAPATWSPVRGAGVRTLSDATPPLPFIGLPPCRLVDTRGTGGIPINTGGAFVANETRTWTLTGLCGLPVIVGAAVSLNFTVVATQSNPFGYLSAGPGGSPVPATTSILNWQAANVQESNAAVVALSNGMIAVETFNAGAHVLVDVNGYYSGSPASNTTFLISDSALIAIYGLTDSTADGAAGVVGVAGAGAGTAFGVFGKEYSPAYNSAGVKGQDYFLSPTSSFYLSAGVRGESRSNYGVLGLSRSVGVGGAVHDSTGTQIAYGLLGTTNGTVTYGVYSGGDFGGSGAKYFVEPHPTDASKVIRYVSLEGPESGTYFRGRARFQNGLATIEAPEDFRMVTDSEGLSIQVTPIGDFASVAVVRIELDEIVVRATRNVEFFYTVNGVRRTHRELTPIGPGMEFMPSSADARMPAYLTEGQKAMLVSNGTYNSDGTVNMETAERLGWAKAWRDRETKSAAAANAAARATTMGGKELGN